MRGRILVVDHKTPTPDQDSGSASAFSYLQILTRAGFDVTFAPLNLADDGRYTAALNALGITTLAAPRWPSMPAIIEEFAPRSDVLLLYRGPVAAEVFDLARRVAPAARILFHATDLHFLRIEREAALHGDAVQAEQARTMRTLELKLVAEADASIVVSGYEQRLLSELVPAAKVHRIPILREAPATPRGLARWRAARPNWRRDILFIGGFDHTPNVDAVQWFVDEVWPMLLRRKCRHRFVIVGSNVPKKIAALACRTIRVRGYVKDLVPLFAGARLSVAPLRYGAGIKGKIVTSLSHGLPVVATSVAVEGMALRAGQDVLVADSAADMAEQIMRLCSDDELWRSLSANGYQAFQNQYSLDAGAQAVLEVVDGLLARAARSVPS